MLTKNEINSIQLSATKKDFYQIWGELAEIADKLSERWDVSSTNESDPGIVLLKVLTAIADKLNYTIDKNTLEAFMPSAAQEESMRKLCNMLGYSMKYYQSAETTVTIKWIGKTNKENSTLILDNDTEVPYISIPQFTVFKNSDEDVTYITKEPAEISYNNLSAEINVIEGEAVQCESENDNIISITNIDDNNRFYLPESQIAENGIFIYNINNGATSSEAWTKVDNLNTQSLNTKCYKFGYDSQEGLPYIQFPEDISTIIEDGLEIWFVRTTGVNGNISANTLSTVTDFTMTVNSEDKTITADSFSITNKNAAVNGTNTETISNAYDSYKKTIGTFDTLVTCRDYMNKIYNLYNDNNIPLVSNVIVSDIRDDINKSITLCSFNEYGISYETKAIQEDNTDLIDHFTLMVYPFKTAYDSGTKKDFTNSFTFSDATFNEIEIALDKYKTLSHNFELPNDDDICCIKNYLKIKAIISTTTKVNALTQQIILNNIYTALYKGFNLRHLNFGDELLSDTIYETIQNADSRIKFVSLDDPEVETRIYTRNGEYSSSNADDSDTYQKLMNKLIIRNVLAGRVPLFNYYEDFKPELNEKIPSDTTIPAVIENITELKSEAKINIDSNSLSTKLLDNEVIQFRAPNLKTKKTISAYVNYYFIHKTDNNTAGTAARMIYLSKWLDTNWDKIYPTDNESSLTVINSTAKFNAANGNGYVILEKNSTSKFIKTSDTSYLPGKQYYYYPLNSTTFANWVLKVRACQYTVNSKSYNYVGIFKSAGSDASRIPGYLVDNNLNKYTEQTSSTKTTDQNLGELYIQDVDTTKTNINVASGLGKDSVIATIEANSDYELKSGEYLYINYTSSSTSSNDDGTSSDTSTEVSTFFGPGTIIRPNFALADSKAYKTSSGKSWPKTIATTKQFNNDDEDATDKQKTLSAGHMWTLGSDEQIEIRELDKTILKPDDENDVENIFVYWEMNDSRQDFFNGASEVSLGENEYFFLTDADKSGLVYYGSGTVIKNYGLTLKKLNKEAIVDIADVLEYGIEALDSVWLKVQTSKNKYIEIQACQFINLTAGDTLKEITLTSDANSSDTNVLDNTFKKCSNASYILSGTESTLPQINISGYTWEVRSKLEFNMGPSLTQKLMDARDTITYGDSKTLTGNSTSPLAIKANYLCQTSADTINVEALLASYKEEDSTVEPEPFKLSCADIDEVKCSITVGEDTVTEDLTMNNFGNNWTKFSFTQFLNNTSTDETASINFNVKLPNTTDYYALMMVYYTQTNAEKTAYMSLPTKETNKLCLFNNDAWKEISDNKYYLNPGINIIQVKFNTTLTLNNANRNDNFIIGPLDIIKVTKTNGISDEGLNLDLLQYKALKTETMSSANSLLTALGNYDPKHQFYYNNILESSKTININADLDENLLSPSCWYDYNNINNKFVICEIDPDYLKTGITIANSSKLK